MRMDKKFAAIVLSAGTGSRMKSDIPKQYMDLNGKPVIYYSLKAFEESPVSSIVLVTGKDDVEYCKKEIVEKYQFEKVVAVVDGGKERYDSVYQGLLQLNRSDELLADYVMVHDGARPMVDQGIIKRSIECLEKEQACVVAVPVKDTIKIADENGYVSSTPSRETLWSVQTPQSFSFSLLKQSYEKVYRDMEEGKEIPLITDDAMVVSYASEQKVKFVMGDYCNIKITTPEDINIAKMMLEG